MSGFAYRDGELCAEGVSLSAIAERFGTPAYVYSRAMLEAAWRRFDAAFAGTPHLVCYAVKANSSLAILDLFARLGSGFDVVSGGELARVLAVGGDPARIVFSGVGKSAAEMQAALAADILCFNVESAPELERLASVAANMRRRARVSLRINPDVDPRTHPYIATGLKGSKFGIAHTDALALYRQAASLSSISVTGIDCHIGSQITDIGAFVETAARIFDLVDRLAAEGIALSHVDLGGGIGVRYRDEAVIGIDDYAAAVRTAAGERRHTLLFEPGRLLVADAGVLLTRVEYLKRGAASNFAIVDAAMNDLLRPALYDAWHGVDPARPRDAPADDWEIVGPVCESADFLAHARRLALAPGDLLAIRSAGAYAMAMSSNYNTRPRACEVLVDGANAVQIRARERVEDLYAQESMLPK
ncbi:MAG: diaminopimelate decarboxylase [Betaproteobacteria bacterium]